MSQEAIRLQKFLASCGIASRRESESLIEAGKVYVNGKKATLGQKVIPGQDTVKYQNKIVEENEKVAFLFNKPRGFICNNDGRERDQKETLSHTFDELKNYPIVIGLEKEASGLILLSNDGDLHQQITKNYKKIERVFHLRFKNEISSDTQLRLQSGIKFEETRFNIDKIQFLKKEGEFHWYKVSCTNHKDKMLEKLFKAAQHPIQRIRQVEFAGIHDEALKKGKGRILTAKEIDILKAELSIN